MRSLGQGQGQGQDQDHGAGHAFSVANSAGGGTDRSSTRGGDRPDTAAGMDFFLRMDVEGEVGQIKKEITGE